MDPTPLFSSSATFRRFWQISQDLVGGLFDGQVPDPRQRRGRRWKLAPLMAALWIGMLTNRSSLRSLERFSGKILGIAYGIWRRLPHTTLWDLLGKLPPAAIRACLVEQILRMHRMKVFASEFPLRVVSIDGKVTRTKRRLNAYCQARHNDGFIDYLYRRLNAVLITSPLLPVLMQIPIPARTNELGALLSMATALSRAYGHSALVDTLMMDSAYASRKHVKRLRRRGYHFIVSIKENQPELRREIIRLYESRFQGRFEVETPWEKYQGKAIRRRLWRTGQISQYMDWPIEQAWVIEQTTRDKTGSEEVELRLFVTSVKWEKLSGEQIVWLVRQHWGIENGVHWVEDKVWQEDRMPWCREGDAIEVLDLLRAMALNVLHYVRFKHLRVADKHQWGQSTKAMKAAWAEMIEEVAIELVNLARLMRERKAELVET